MRTKPTLNVLAALTAGSLLLAACGSSEEDGAGEPGGGGAADTNLRLALNQTEDHPSFIALDNFGDRLKERTNGAYDIEVYPNETLGAQQEALQLVSDGAVDMAIVSGPQLENLNEDFKVFNLPNVFDSIDHQMKVVHDPEIVSDLYAALEDSNQITVIGGFTQGARSIYTSDGPAESPKDLNGKKIRVQESDLFVQMIRAMGGSATPMAYGEVYTALQSGVLDGAENNEVSYYTQKHFEVAPYFTYTNHLIGLDYLVINSETLAGMSDEDRTAFDEEWTAAYEEHTDLWADATQDAIDQASAGGATFTEIDTAPFDEALAPIVDKFLTTDSQRALYEAARNAAE